MQWAKEAQADPTYSPHPGAPNKTRSGRYATPDEFGPNKRPTVLYFRTDTNPIRQGETARFDVYMAEGPKSKCSYNIYVWTVDACTDPQATTNY